MDRLTGDRQQVVFGEPVKCSICGYEHFYADTKTCFDCRSCEIRIDRMAERSLPSAINFLERKLAELKAVRINRSEAKML
jgi:hypothetical protein